MRPSAELRPHPATRGRRGARSRILLFSATRDWHARQLAAAFARHGVDATIMRLEACAFDSGSPSGLRCGRTANPPDGVLVRTVAAGSFEAVTRRLGLLHALKQLGVPVWNDAAAIERCVDKSMTTFLLARAGLPVPRSWTVEGIEPARRIVEEQAGAGPLVAKPLFGSQGRGLVLVRKPADLPAPETVAGVYYLQRFAAGAGPAFRDFRVFVLEGEPIAGMAREGATWVTNVKQGGRPVAVPRDLELGELAAGAARAVGASFCGVDILRGPDGRPYVLEVNSMPAWSGLQTVTDINIAEALAGSFCRSLGSGMARCVA
jgi:tetrahydromethanopterin:alpha-L-glutamate ligase